MLSERFAPDDDNDDDDDDGDDDDGDGDNVVDVVVENATATCIGASF
jgi:hypothetical protein